MQRSMPVVLCALVCLGLEAQAATINVPADQATIQDAVDAAVAGDEILVAPGTYTENVSINKNITLLSSGGRASTTIDGVSSAGALGAITITGGTSDVQIGAVGQGFTILGVDNGAPGVENAAIYFQGGHSDAEIYDNEIVARGDAGLITEYGATISGFIIDGNEFSGSTFFDPPAGYGFSQQFTLPNVPRQLVVMGCGGGCTNTSNVTFTNNVISGTAGGINIDSDEQGNTLCTLDGDGMIITGNAFSGTTTRFASSLRVRGPSTTVSGNNFDSAGLTASTSHIYTQSTGSDISDIAAANTFDKGVYVDGAIGIIGPSLQAFAAGAPSGSIVDVLPGTYTEQIVIDGIDLTLRGSGAANTTVASPASLATTFTTSGPNKAIISAMNSADIVLQDMTIDGQGLGNANNRFVGVGYWNAGGAIVDCDIIDIIDTPFSGVQHGVGILSANDTGGPYDLELDGVDISTFQKNAMVLSGAGLTVDVHDCTVTGMGWTSVTAQNGIQIGFGTGGVVTDNTISEIGYIGSPWAAGGLLMISGSNIDATGTHNITNVQVPAWWQDTPGTIGGINASGDLEYGSLIYNLTAAAHRSEDVVPVQASPWDAGETGGSSAQAGITITYSGGCFNGAVAASPFVGIYGYSGGQPLTILAENMRVSGFDTGIVADGAATTIDITNSFIAGNTTAGYDNTLSGNSQDATQNWWGASDGPSGVGTGSGDAIAGTGVDFDPWRLDDASSTPCGFTPTSTNEVTPTAPGGCISGPSPCVTVPVEITRSDNAQMRGFSVDIQLTNLALCGTEITEGTYLSAIGGTVFQVLDNGGGSYTVDCAILGLPCGQDAITGTLFDVAVTTGGTDGTGTLTVTDVIFRDCDNVDIPGAPGAPLDIDIDTVAPVAVADLAAAQVTSGNDTDGTTAVNLTFSAPGDASVIEVYRAPYGTTTTNAYPEYDDLAGAAAPAVPTYPPAAPWAITGVTASGQDDETGDRGFWYYVVFTKDVCGNISAASNVSTGTLNYHLGDVSDGFVMGQGDNDVASEDISLLGANYGATLVFGDAVNYLDVGPTADGTTSSLPETDDLVAFEDLILFAINFGQVSRPEGWTVAADLGADSVLPSVRLEFGPNATGLVTKAKLLLESNVQLVQGFHVVVEGVRAATAGPLIGDQAHSVFFETLDSEAGLVIDGAGLGQPMRGAGVLAMLEVLPGQTPRIVVSDLRDHANQSIGDQGGGGTKLDLEATRASLSEDAAISATQVLGAWPNPTGGHVDIRFRIANSDRVSIQVFDVEGRLVRTLTNQELAAGEHTVEWDGRNDRGLNVGSGVYLYRFQGDGVETTEKIYLYR